MLKPINKYSIISLVFEALFKNKEFRQMMTVPGN
jgi:hypothetical protein